MTFLVGCNNANSFCEKISKALDVTLVKTVSKKFPDGETYVRVNADLEDKDVFVVQSGYPNQNDALIELYLTLDAIRDMDPRSIRLIFTYMPYSKQDKRFKEGEAVSSGTILKLLKSFKINQLSAINLHFAEGEDEFDFFNMGIKNLNAAPLIEKYVNEKYGDFVTVLPGKGGSQLLNGDNLIFLETIRDEYTEKGKEYFGESNLIAKDLEKIKGKVVLVLDDMINTGGTMVKTCDLVRKSGANKVISACVHGLFVGDSVSKLEKSRVDDIIATDTIENKFGKVSVVPLIVEEIKSL